MVRRCLCPSFTLWKVFLMSNCIHSYCASRHRLLSPPCGISRELWPSLSLSVIPCVSVSVSCGSLCFSPPPSLSFFHPLLPPCQPLICPPLSPSSRSPFSLTVSYSFFLFLSIPVSESLFLCPCHSASILTSLSAFLCFSASVWCLTSILTSSHHLPSPHPPTTHPLTDHALPPCHGWACLLPVASRI